MAKGDELDDFLDILTSSENLPQTVSILCHAQGIEERAWRRLFREVEEYLKQKPELADLGRVNDLRWLRSLEDQKECHNWSEARDEKRDSYEHWLGISLNGQDFLCPYIFAEIELANKNREGGSDPVSIPIRFAVGIGWNVARPASKDFGVIFGKPGGLHENFGKQGFEVRKDSDSWLAWKYLDDYKFQDLYQAAVAWRDRGNDSFVGGLGRSFLSMMNSLGKDLHEFNELLGKPKRKV